MRHTLFKHRTIHNNNSTITHILNTIYIYYIIVAPALVRSVWAVYMHIRSSECVTVAECSEYVPVCIALCQPHTNKVQ